MIVDDIIAEILKDKPETVPNIYIVGLQIKPGGYGEGDTICGTSVPKLRHIAKKYRDIHLSDCEKLLQNNLHEARFVAVTILKHIFKNCPKDVVSLYLKNISYVNNWDLVDCSAPHIIGPYSLITKNNSIIDELSESASLWENRIAVVSTLAHIKAGNFLPTVNLCHKFINHKHHLIQKACGWMLREVSKKDPHIVLEFVSDHPEISSIMKSYALEWMRKNKHIYTAYL